MIVLVMLRAGEVVVLVVVVWQVVVWVRVGRVGGWGVKVVVRVVGWMVARVVGMIVG